jgi:hypothetical protein
MPQPSAEDVFLSERSFSDNYLEPPTSLNEMEDPYILDFGPTEPGSAENIVVLSLLLALSLITNLSAFPIILFRRTK